MISIKNLKYFFILYLITYPLTLQASFIESSMGAAVVNDATAAYFNPAALILLKKPQIITLDSIAHFRTEFTGQAVQLNTSFTQSGSTTSQTHYHLPSLYLGLPTNQKIALGLAVILNAFNKDTDGHSLLRYAQSSNSIQNLDVVPAIGFKLTDDLSFGAGINFSYASFLLRPTTGFPSLDIPDTQSRNKCDGTGCGGDIGLLFKPSPATMIGFNYRTSITYHLSGTSIFESDPEVTSNHYGFTFWTPARSVLSINQLITPTLGIIGTVQRIEWSIFNEINIRGIATEIRSQPVILDATVPYHWRNTWLLTLGGHYRITPQWVIRIASTYNQAPGNSNFQISNGDSIIVGGSMGYEITKHMTIDASYAHDFIQSENIHATTIRNKIDGSTKGSLDALSLKLTFNL